MERDKGEVKKMVLSLHILIALSSVFYTAYVFFYPSQSKLRGSYLLLALTIVTGTYLVIAKPSNLTQICVTGLVYIGVMLAGILVVRRKLSM